ncbi:MAG: DNA polymerase III subunit delta [Solirubrobacteraceae bacterium]
MAQQFKPAYLVHGDDHGRIAERRARLRAVAESASGASGIELLEGEEATPEAVAAALRAMTFALGRRFVIVEGVERWKEADVAPVVAVLRDPPPETTVVFFAREEGRTRAPKQLGEAVRGAGGDVFAEQTVKPWELPKWVTAEARRQGIELDAGAAKALVGQVGERQQRLARELEKLAIELGPDARLTAEDVDELAAASAERKVWSLADALLAGDGAAATRLYLELRERGERVPSLLYWMTRRLREAHDVLTRVEAGEPVAEVKRSIPGGPRVAARFLDEVGKLDRDRLRRALEAMADLELASRGGATAASEDTAALRAIVEVAQPA